MDRFIASYPAEPDGDLMLCREEGVAYQADQSILVAYDAAYYDKCAGYSGQEIADRINRGRIDFVAKHYGSGRAVDVGIGSGEFIRRRGNTYGHDVNPAGIEWLKRNDLWTERLTNFGAATFWDVLEHCPEPGFYLRQIQLHCWAFVSLPIFYGLGGIRTSKHYRPGEHLYYWTAEGFVDWMGRHGFMAIEMDDFEIQAGRESIQSFAFKRYRWPK
jgi:hypothetical protein